MDSPQSALSAASRPAPKTSLLWAAAESFLVVGTRLATSLWGLHPFPQSQQRVFLRGGHTCLLRGARPMWEDQVGTKWVLLSGHLKAWLGCPEGQAGV